MRRVAEGHCREGGTAAGGGGRASPGRHTCPVSRSVQTNPHQHQRQHEHAKNPLRLPAHCPLLITVQREFRHAPKAESLPTTPTPAQFPTKAGATQDAPKTGRHQRKIEQRGRMRRTEYVQRVNAAASMAAPLDSTARRVMSLGCVVRMFPETSPFPLPPSPPPPSPLPPSPPPPSALLPSPPPSPPPPSRRATLPSLPTPADALQAPGCFTLACAAWPA